MYQNHKRIIAGLLTAAMIVPMTVSTMKPLQVSAYELLGETTFEHKMIPWLPTENAPAMQTFDIDDGAAHMTILRATGLDRSQWDLEFRHKGLFFRKGHEYKVSFRVKAKREGMELCSYIGTVGGENQYFVLNGGEGNMQMGPDMGGYWGRRVKLTEDYQVFSGIFIPTEDADNAEWCFRYGNDSNGYGGNAEEGDEIWFDDMSIEDMTDPDYIPPAKTYGITTRTNSGLENNYISVNQLGYYPGLAKHAVLGDDTGDVIYGSKPIELTGTYDYEIVKTGDDTVVYSGKTGKPVKDSASGDTVCKIDFSAFDQPGEYYIRIIGEKWRSFPFRIGTDIYRSSEHDLLTDALNYFYQNRAGTDIKQTYITSGEKDQLAHKNWYGETVGVVQDGWYTDMLTKVKDADTHGSSKISTNGGWYTGAYFYKYMTEGGFSVWTLQNMYERAIRTEAGKQKFADESGTVVIPEAGNAYPDILDECRYELDYMAQMKVQPDEKTWGEFAGLYYHRIQGIGFEPNPLDYDCDAQTIYTVKPPTFAATLNYAACAAQGARLWAPYDPDYAAELLKNAKDAYQAYKTFWYEAENRENMNVQSLYAVEYSQSLDNPDCDTMVLDDAYRAACELYISASELNDADAASYLSELSEYSHAFEFPLSKSGGSNEMFDTDDPGAAGSISLLLHQELLTDEQVKKLTDSILAAAESYLSTEAQQGYGTPFRWKPDYSLPNGLDYIPDEGYRYGSNNLVVNNLIVLAYAYDLTCDVRYLNGVAAGMDYLLGNNPMAFSFITGYGKYHAENPAHRYWLREVDQTLPSAPDGVLVSGPNAGLHDTYLRVIGFQRAVSDRQSQRYYADSVEAWSANEASLTCNASLAWIVSFMQDEAPAVSVSSDVPGDLNADGELLISDAVLLQKWLTSVPGTKLSGWKAADFDKNNQLNALDLTYMKRKLTAGTR